MEITVDCDGNELLLKDGNYQVMMEWEKPYMEACIDALRPTGNVLEIGFGLGYSASAIQSFPIHSHVIIEYDETVIERGNKWAENKQGVQFIHGTWQEVLPSLGMFDAIFFDDYPIERKPQKNPLEDISIETQAITDEEIDGFITLLKNKEMEVIEDAYLAKFIASLPIEASKKTYLQKECEKLGIHLENSIEEPVFSQRTDRLGTFLEMALPHLNVGGRFSCYLEDVVSLYDNPYIFEHIICNPNYTLSEKLFPVSPPKHCAYFTKNEAVVMTITKDL